METWVYSGVGNGGDRNGVVDVLKRLLHSCNIVGMRMTIGSLTCLQTVAEDHATELPLARSVKPDPLIVIMPIGGSICTVGWLP